MPLQKISLKPGVNRENTRYTNEGGWYESDKVRFRQGTPEKIGGWERISANTFLGVCRSLWNWVTLGFQNLLGVGTNLKFYIENGGAYYDITPVRDENTLTNPFATTSGSSTVTVTDAAGGFTDGDFVTYTGSSAAGGITILGEYQITLTGATTYTIPLTSTATISIANPAVFTTKFKLANNVQVTLTTTGELPDPFVAGTTYYVVGTSGYTFNLSLTSGGTAISTIGSGQTGVHTVTAKASSTTAAGGSTVYAVYQISVGLAAAAPMSGWGAGFWGSGSWGFSETSTEAIRIWSQINWGESLLYGPRGGGIYYWNASIGYTPPAVTISISTPCVVTTSLNLPDKTALMFQTDGSLPTGLTVGTLYYTSYLTATTFYLTTTPDPLTITITASCSGSGTNTLNITAVDGILVAGMTVFYGVGLTTNLGILSFTGTGTGGTGTYSVSAGAVVSSSTMSALTMVNTSGTQSGTHRISVRGISIASLNNADGYAPLYQNTFTVSDASRFVLTFGANDYGSTTLDPMLIRWSDQESLTTWYPSATNQAGSLRLSHGSKIVTTLQSRQEIVVWTDSSVYSLQYLGPPIVWGSQLLADNISIASPNAAAMASGVTYWMGVDKFYRYDGRVQTLRCDLRQFIYSNINTLQYDQIFASTNEGFNEVWFFYCSASSSTIDRYVIYNYAEDVWAYGTMGRTAWLDSGLRDYPIAATYNYNIVNQESGVDDNETATALPIEASITSAQFDIGDGHNFAFVYRMIPDMTFRGSTSGTTPSVTMYLQGLNNSGSGITQTGNSAVTYAGTAPSVINVDEYTGQLYIRIRGRQMQMKITSSTVGVQWQLGAPRIDIRPDGRR
jgi:hypothetical protein